MWYYIKVAVVNRYTIRKEFRKMKKLLTIDRIYDILIWLSQRAEHHSGEGIELWKRQKSSSEQKLASVGEGQF